MFTHPSSIHPTTSIHRSIPAPTIHKLVHLHLFIHSCSCVHHPSSHPTIHQHPFIHQCSSTHHPSIHSSIDIHSSIHPPTHPSIPLKIHPSSFIHSSIHPYIYTHSSICIHPSSTDKSIIQNIHPSSIYFHQSTNNLLIHPFPLINSFTNVPSFIRHHLFF